MGKRWAAVAVGIACWVSGCGDDAETGLPPEADAGKSGRSPEAGTDMSGAETLNLTTDSVHSERSHVAPEDAGVGTFDATTPIDTTHMSDAAWGTTVTNVDARVTSDASKSEETTSGGTDVSDATDVNSAASDAAAADNSNGAQDASALDSTDGDATSESLTDSAVAFVDAGAADAGDDENPEPLEARAGFIDIERVNYTLRNSASYEASSARMFYAFTPADELPEEAPVFVLFNGGPGSATSSGLMSYGTGPYSLPSDLSGPNLTPNPWSWTQMGNLLYFDTRQAGFSYSLLEDPSDSGARALEWDERNFNLYIDAADSVRLVLRVLSQLPALRDNPIVLVGESYGGTRATMMLWYLLNSEWLRESNLYQDASLADEIASFFSTNALDSGDSVAVQAKRQLPAQVLIQPFFAGDQLSEQDGMRCLVGSPAQQVAAELGTECRFVENQRDAYKIDEPPTWSIALDVMAQQTLMHPTKLPTLLGVELDAIQGLASTERGGAFRDVESGWYAPSPEFVAELGQLEPWDAYHLTLTPRSPWPESTYTDGVPCVVFPWVAQQVDTMITNARWDNVVLTAVLPTTLSNCAAASDGFVDSIGFTPAGDFANGASGQMVFQFNDTAPEGASETAVEIRGYESGHMVTVTHAEPLYRDVQAFLSAHGVL